MPQKRQLVRRRKSDITGDNCPTDNRRDSCKAECPGVESAVTQTPLKVGGPHGNLEPDDASWLMENVYVWPAGRDDARRAINTQYPVTATRQIMSVARRKFTTAVQGRPVPSHTPPIQKFTVGCDL